jgi:SAM-dependent methyltransferase
MILLKKQGISVNLCVNFFPSLACEQRMANSEQRLTMSKDLFSQQSDQYALYRPVYPTVLFEYILQYVENRKLAWDCATGNGQAAVALADYFEKIIATDSSEKQIANAVLRTNIEYAICLAEKTNFPDKSVDLVTVAQAYHWLNAPAFKNEVMRVAKPGAVIAIWGYNIPLSGYQELDDEISFFYKKVVGPYWDAERRYIDESYKTAEFDFPELPSRDFSIEVRWTLDHFIGYLNSWSSVQHYITANSKNPVSEFFPRLAAQWPGAREIEFKFPVFLRIGRVAISF